MQHNKKSPLILAGFFVAENSPSYIPKILFLHSVYTFSSTFSSHAKIPEIAPSSRSPVASSRLKPRLRR